MCIKKFILFLINFRDAVATERAVELAANTKGICYIRLSRPATEIVYDNDEEFAIGKAKILRKSDSDCVLVIAAGITLSQAVPAVEQLASKGNVTRLSTIVEILKNLIQNFY